MAFYPGKDSVVYMSTTGVGQAVKVVGINKWTINRQADKYEVTSFGDVNKNYVLGLPDLQGSFSGFWNDTESKPFVGAASTTGVFMYLYASTNALTKFWMGPAWVDISMDTPISGPPTISVNFAANGSWTVNF